MNAYIHKYNWLFSRLHGYHLIQCLFPAGTAWLRPPTYKMIPMPMFTVSNLCVLLFSVYTLASGQASTHSFPTWPPYSQLNGFRVTVALLFHPWLEKAEYHITYHINRWVEDERDLFVNMSYAMYIYICICISRSSAVETTPAVMDGS